MRNFEKAKQEGWKVLEKHPRMDLHASELRELIAKYSGQDLTKSIYSAITDMWLAGVAAGYKIGKADAEARKD